MKLDRNHPFEQQAAIDRLRALTAYWGKYGVDSTWAESKVTIKGNIKGVKFTANIEVLDKRLNGEIKAGFLGEKLGRAYVEKKLDEYFDPNANLDELKERT